MKILGISGKKQSGKTTAANLLEDKLGYDYTTYRISLADELKIIVNKCFCEGHECFDTEEQKSIMLSCNKTVRDVLQLVGTDWFRSLDHDCWVRAYKKNIERAERKSAGEVFVITPDVRFPNEVGCIQKLGGHVIRLLREPFPDDKHESEIALDDMETATMTLIAGDPNYLQGYCGRIFNAIIDNRYILLLIS